MSTRVLALSATTMALLFGSIVLVSAPASASANFTPQTGIIPGTVFDDMTITATGGDLLCVSAPGVENQTGDTVEMGLLFVASEDENFDLTGEDDFVGGTNTSVAYTAGALTSAAFDAEVEEALVPYDRSKNLLAIPFCDGDGAASMGAVMFHGAYVVGYSDATMENSTVSPGGTATLSVVDATTESQFCDGVAPPLSLGFRVFESVAAYENGELGTLIPEGWDNDGPGFGSFSLSELADGIDGAFTVPTTLAAGDYVGIVFCIGGDGAQASSPGMGLVPFTVGSDPEEPAPELANTGMEGVGFGAAALAALLVTCGAFMVRRRHANA